MSKTIVTDPVEITRLLKIAMDQVHGYILVADEVFPLEKIRLDGHRLHIIVQKREQCFRVAGNESVVQIGRISFRVHQGLQILFTITMPYPRELSVEMEETEANQSPSFPESSTPPPKPVRLYVAPVRSRRIEDRPEWVPHQLERDPWGVWVMGALFVVAVVFLLFGLPWLEAKFF